MEFDSIKSNWKKAGIGIKAQDELLMMTKVKNHPHIIKIRIKLIIEAILIIVFLSVYYNMFDGATKPLWANLLLILSAISFIIIRVAGWLVLRNPIRSDNLKKSLAKFQNRLKQMAFSNMLTSFLFGMAIILFFISSVNFTNGKYLLLGGIIFSLILLAYLSSRNWFHRVKSINLTLKEFNQKR